MTDRKSPFNAIPFDFSHAVRAPEKKNRLVMNQIFASVMKQSNNQVEYSGPALTAAARRSPLPDGTGQIINIGI
jgi:hypothetical protein